MRIAPERIQAPAAAQRRALPIGEAATYVGCKNVAQFRREVMEGKWPAPMPISSRPQRWDKAALDRAIDKMSNIRPKSDPVNPWDEVLGHGGKDVVRP